MTKTYIIDCFVDDKKIIKIISGLNTDKNKAIKQAYKILEKENENIFIGMMKYLKPITKIKHQFMPLSFVI